VSTCISRHGEFSQHKYEDSGFCTLCGAPVDPTAEDFLEIALQLVKANGYVVLKEKSYRQAQERQRIAQVMADYEKERREGAERWARDCCEDERRVRERLTFVWGIAMKHGATLEEMAADPVTRPARQR
jgi:hypothetical protein